MQPEPIDEIFLALGNPIRRKMIDYIAKNESATIGELAEPFDVSLNAISKHIKILERSGIVTREIKGREHHCRLNPQALQDASQWLAYYSQFWMSALDNLEQEIRRQNELKEANEFEDS